MPLSLRNAAIPRIRHRQLSLAGCTPGLSVKQPTQPPHKLIDNLNQFQHWSDNSFHNLHLTVSAYPYAHWHTLSRLLGMGDSETVLDVQCSVVCGRSDCMRLLLLLDVSVVVHHVAHYSQHHSHNSNINGNIIIFPVEYYARSLPLAKRNFKICISVYREFVHNVEAENYFIFYFFYIN